MYDYYIVVIANSMRTGFYSWVPSHDNQCDLGYIISLNDLGYMEEVPYG